MDNENCPNPDCRTYLAKGWTRCGMCGNRKPNDMRTDKMHPLPWTHYLDRQGCSAVLDAKGNVVCGSLIYRPDDKKKQTEARQTHEFIVEAANNTIRK